MSILVFGKTGQVATELRRHADVQALGRDAVDLRNAKACADAIHGCRPTAIINAAAYTAVDQAENDEATAMAVNAAAPAAMAQTATELGIPFIHISTDYVFDGSGSTPWRPDAPVAPLGVYGRSKLAGEQAVMAEKGSHAILRTSWVFSAHGSNFVKTMLRLSDTRDQLKIVADQIGGPTPAADIAMACLQMLRGLQDGAPPGLYHFAGAPNVSWADFAREIFSQSGHQITVDDIPTSAYPTPAQRPLNSRLDCTTTEAQFGITRPDWRRGLARVLTELKETEHE